MNNAAMSICGKYLIISIAMICINLIAFFKDGEANTAAIAIDTGICGIVFTSHYINKSRGS